MKRSQDKPQILLDHHLKTLKLPVFARERQKTAAQCAKEQDDYGESLLRLSEAELLERERKGTERRIKTARFPARKSLDDFDFPPAPSVNKARILGLANY